MTLPVLDSLQVAGIHHASEDHQQMAGKMTQYPYRNTNSNVHDKDPGCFRYTEFTTSQACTTVLSFKPSRCTKREQFTSTWIL